jgi:hypothetical protein
MQSIIGQLQDQIKVLSGDLQTAQRESIADRKRVVVEKFKSQVDNAVTKANADTRVNAEKVKQKQKEQVQADMSSLMSEDINEL